MGESLKQGQTTIVADYWSALELLGRETADRIWQEAKALKSEPLPISFALPDVSPHNPDDPNPAPK